MAGAVMRGWLYAFACLIWLSLCGQLGAQTLRGPVRAASGFSTALSPTAVVGTVDSSVQSWANAVVAAGGAPVADARLQLLSTMVAGLKADGVWTKLDWFLVTAGPDVTAARYNLRNSAKAITAVNSPTFTVDRGFTGDGSTSYLDLGEAVGASGNQYTLNSASLGVWINQQNATTSATITGVLVTSGPATSIIARATSGNETYRINNTTSELFQANVGTRTGHRAAVRPAAAAFSGFYGAQTSSTISQVVTSTTASTALATSNQAILRGGSAYDSDRVAAFWSGSAMSTADMSAIQSRLYTFLSAIGAN